MARRSSARLRARNSATPQPSKTADFFQDGRLRTPKTAPQLASVAEMEDMPGAFPRSVSPNNDTPTKLAKHIADAVAGNTRTPQHKKPRPSEEEMHPQRFQASTTKPLDEARWLGFSEMAAHTEPPKSADKRALTVDTPSKIVRNSDTQPGAFEFTFRAQSLELSAEARQMMAEKREEAARIKHDMARIEEERQEAQTLEGRKIAQLKGKSGRFSDVHKAQFKKMDSIANHASAARPSSRDKMEDVPAMKREGPSLKRTGSKANLKQGRREDETKGTFKQHSTKTQEKSLRRPSPDEVSSPAKRIRLESPKPATNMSSSVIKVAPPSVQLQRSIASMPASPGKISYPKLATPTRSSMAKAATVRVNKTSMIPSLTRTPSKSASKAVPTDPEAAKSTLFARSPTKFAHMSAKKEAPRQVQGSPLLARSPTKSIFGNRLHVASKVGHDGASDGDHTPLLSRSPSRKPKESSSEESESGNKTPLLSRSPLKAGSDSNPFAALKSTPGPQANLMDRFKLLRQSPVKSILRSPQRLYSNDPNKIASGTHLATPPPKQPAFSKYANPPIPRAGLVVPATEPIRKHVDFSASTKSNDDSIPLSKSIIQPSNYPVLPSYPPLPSLHESPCRSQRRQTLGPLNPQDFTFRVGSSITFGPSPSATTPSPKPSIRHVSADPEPPSTSMQRKRKFVDDEDDVFSPGRSDGPSDKENDANTANIAAGREAAAAAVAAARPAKRVRKDAPPQQQQQQPPARPAAAGGVPSWAQGTAAQKARASLARQKATAPVKGKTTRPSTVGGGRPVAPVGNAAAEAKAAGEKKPGAAAAAVMSRARLDALSRPKHR